MKILCMAEDGEFIIDSSTHESIDDAWDYANDFGSKWIFYPYVFIINDAELTIVAGCDNLEYLKGKRIKTVKELFKKAYEEYTE